MTLFHVDVCVIGHELSGLIAGALLANAGARVVVLRHTPSFDEIPLGEWMTPALPAFWQIPKNQAFLGIFDELELKTDLRQGFGAKTSIGALEDPRERLIFEPHPLKISTELKRVFGTAGKEAFELLDNAPWDDKNPLFYEAKLLHETGFFKEMSRKKRISKLGNYANPYSVSKSVQKVCSGPLKNTLDSFCDLIHYDAKGTLNSVAAYTAGQLLNFGANQPIGNHVSSYHALKLLFIDSLKRRGGEYKIEEIRSIDIPKKRISKIETNLNTYIPTVVIHAEEQIKLSDFISQPKLKAKMIEYEEITRHVGSSNIIRWLLPKHVIPYPMPKLNILNKTPDYPFAGALGIFTPWKHSGGRTTNLAAVVLAQRSFHSVSNLEEQTRRRLNETLPFAKDFIIAEDSLKSSVIKDVWPLFEVNPEQATFLGGKSIYSPLTDVFHAGRDVIPILGIDGELLCAHTVSLACERVLLDKQNPAFYRKLLKPFLS